MTRRNSQQDPIMRMFSAMGSGLLGIGKYVWRLIFGKSGVKKLNQAALFADWQAIESIANSSDQIHLSQAVQQADKYIDHIMQLVGGSGATFADRLRSLESKMNPAVYQGLWNAHKLRNGLAHTHGATVSVSSAKQALAGFRSAARSLGAF